MKTYKLSPEYIKKTTINKILSRCVGVYIIFYFMNLIPPLKFGIDNPSSIIALLIVVTFWAYITRRDYREMLEYEITLDDESIKRKEVDVPDVQIRRESIIEIQEDPKKGLTVRSNNVKESVTIPKGLENYAEVKSQLLDWHKIEPFQ